MKELDKEPGSWIEIEGGENEKYVEEQISNLVVITYSSGSNKFSLPSWEIHSKLLRE